MGFKPKQALFVLAAMLCATLHAQQYPSDFILPLDSALYLSGSFGEPRVNHFHAGIDIKTGGREGLPVKAAADGYVYRIKVSPYGYGKALYVQHYNGFTTVYGHLSRFNDEIETYIRKNQYRKRTFSIELFPAKTLFKFRKGDIIAYSGNTGGSQAPHLHFEIRDGKTQEIINPRLFGLGFEDSIAPLLDKVILYRFETEDREIRPKSFLALLPHELDQAVEVPPGIYGIGLVARDYVNERNNYLYPEITNLYCDSQLYYSRNVERFRFNESKYIAALFDYPYYSGYREQVEKCFRHPRILDLNFIKLEGNGLVNFQNREKKTFLIQLKDVSGNEQNYSLQVSAKEGVQKEFGKICHAAGNFKVEPSTTSSYHDDNCLIDFGINTFFEENTLNIRSYFDDYGNPMVMINDSSCALAVNTKIGLTLNLPPAYLDPKYKGKVLICDTEGGAYGGIVQEQSIKSYVRQTGTFSVAIDTVAPLINEPELRDGNIYVTVSDKLSGIANYNAYINNTWYLMEYDPKTATLKGDLKDYKKEPVLNFKLTVTDERNNTSTISRKLKN